MNQLKQIKNEPAICTEKEIGLGLIGPKWKSDPKKIKIGLTAQKKMVIGLVKILVSTLVISNTLSYLHPKVVFEIGKAYNNNKEIAILSKHEIQIFY